MAYVNAVLKMIKLCKSRDSYRNVPFLPEQQNSARPSAWSAQQLTKKKKPSEPHRFTAAKGLSSKYHFRGPNLLFQSRSFLLVERFCSPRAILG